MKPIDSRLPKHVGLILDGNRRFAKRLMIKPWKGHELGAKKIWKLFDWCKELGIHEVTLYTFSIENFNRPKAEFDYLMALFEREFKAVKKDPRIQRDGIRINFIGRIKMFPKGVYESMVNLMEFTKHNKNYIVNFAMAYGGRAEVIDAAKKIAKMVKDGKLSINQINEEVFSKELYLESEPDLIIRTSGEQRTSGFLIWQGSYAELYWCEKMWPEFEKEDFIEALEDYMLRERRFGK